LRNRVVSPTHRPPLPPGNIAGIHFCYRLVRPQDHSAAERIKSIKNSNGTIRNRTRNLLAQCLNQLQHRVPHFITGRGVKIWVRRVTAVYGVCKTSEVTVYVVRTLLWWRHCRHSED